MKIKLDENIPKSLALALAELGHDVDTVIDEGLTGADDAIVWRECRQACRFLVTQDIEFGDTRLFRPGTHSGVLLVRLQHAGRGALHRRIRHLFATEEVETWNGAVVVMTESKIRVRRDP